MEEEYKVDWAMKDLLVNYLKFCGSEIESAKKLSPSINKQELSEMLNVAHNMYTAYKHKDVTYE